MVRDVIRISNINIGVSLSLRDVRRESGKFGGFYKYTFSLFLGKKKIFDSASFYAKSVDDLRNEVLRHTQSTLKKEWKTIVEHMYKSKKK